jgi:hypothetical protein
VNSIWNEMSGAVFQEQADAWKDHFETYLDRNHKDFKTPREMERQLRGHTEQWNPNGIVQTQFAVLEAAVRADMEPKIRAEVEAELREERKTADAKKASNDARTTPKPTAVSGTAGGGGRITTMDDADNAWNDGLINIDQYRDYRKKFGVR